MRGSLRRPFYFVWKCDIMRNGKVAEWLKALVLKTRDGNIRRFESCPFRHVLTDVHKKQKSLWLRIIYPVLSFFLCFVL